MNKRYLLFSLFLCLGCGSTAVRQSADVADPAKDDSAAVVKKEQPEEFEGIVELFGHKLKARRQVRLDENGDYVKHGLATAWYESGQLAGQMHFRDNLPHGPQRVWHENGRKKALGEWQDGMAIGRWTEWHDNGQKSSEGIMENGKKHGRWSFWGTDGQLTEEIVYQFGREVEKISARPPSKAKK